MQSLFALFLNQRLFLFLLLLIDSIIRLFPYNICILTPASIKSTIIVITSAISVMAFCPFNFLFTFVSFIFSLFSLHLFYFKILITFFNTILMHFFYSLHCLCIFLQRFYLYFHCFYSFFFCLFILIIAKPFPFCQHSIFYIF